jgi:hypothetical protein
VACDTSAYCDIELAQAKRQTSFAQPDKQAIRRRRTRVGARSERPGASRIGLPKPLVTSVPGGLSFPQGRIRDGRVIDAQTATHAAPKAIARTLPPALDEVVQGLPTTLSSYGHDGLAKP